jgi:hypothetical protein
MDMKKLLNIVSDKQQLNESFDSLEACGDPMPGSTPQNAMPPTPPMSMNVNMNASGADQIKQLMQIISGAQATPAEPPKPVEMPIQISQEEFANGDESEVMDLDAVIHDGDDLHKQKRAYKAAQPGDNAMAVENIKLDLKNLYKQIKES